MGLNITDTKNQLQQEWKKSTLTADELTLATDKAVRFYARLKPLTGYAVLTTVVNVAEYAKPPDAAEVTDVIWNWAGVLSAVQDRYPVFPVGTPRDVADYPIHSINREALLDGRKGEWSMRGDDIVLAPIPSSSGSDIEVFYTRDYIENGDGTEWPDIPTRNIDVIVLLAMAELLSIEVGKVSTLPDYRSGMLSFRRRGSVSDMRTMILQLRRDAAQRLGVPMQASAAVQGRVA